MAKPTRQPDEKLHCLLIQPLFQASNFWNLTESAATTGAKTVAPPLGLLTVAALLAFALPSLLQGDVNAEYVLS